MATSNDVDLRSTNDSQSHDHVLRPRPRKPQHSQISGLVKELSSTAASQLTVEDPASGLTRYVSSSRFGDISDPIPVC